MSEVLDLRQGQEFGQNLQFIEPKKKKGWLKILAVIVLSVGLTTLGIKASDKLFWQEEEESNNSFCPENMVFIPSSVGGFCLDKFEVSAGKSCPVKNPSNQEETRINLEAEGCFAVSSAGEIPWRNISQNQAAVACAKAGKRLPTAKEWLQASLGTPDKDSGWDRSDCQVNNNWKEQPGPAGTGKNCVSAVGAYDMIGNVWEWVDETVEEGKYKGILLPDDGYIKGIDSYGLPTETGLENPDQNYGEDYLWIKKNETKGILRGGYWGNRNEGGIYSVYLVFAPSFAGDSVGFRCAK